MADSTRDSDRILTDARSSLAYQQGGGRRAGGGSIGKGSARLKWEHLAKKLVRLAAALAVILVAAMGFGLFVSALGFEGVMITLLLMIVAVFFFLRYPKMKVPSRADLTRGSLTQTVQRTELWLERQAPALPAPAANLVNRIGSQLDGLGVQLQGLDENTPAAVEVRKLVGDHLPDMVSSYTAIPAHLRGEQRAGSTPDKQLIDGLERISVEIDTVTRQLAEGALDELAIRSRYLDYRYGGPETPLGEVSPQDAGLPPPSAGDTALPPPAAGNSDSGVPLTFEKDRLPSRSRD